jgi:hypothetical protein
VGDILCEIETDKATLEFESLEEGYFFFLLFTFFFLSSGWHLICNLGFLLLRLKGKEKWKIDNKTLNYNSFLINIL